MFEIKIVTSEDGKLVDLRGDWKVRGKPVPRAIDDSFIRTKFECTWAVVDIPEKRWFDRLEGPSVRHVDYDAFMQNQSAIMMCQNLIVREFAGYGKQHVYITKVYNAFARAFPTTATRTVQMHKEFNFTQQTSASRARDARVKSMVRDTTKQPTAIPTKQPTATPTKQHTATPTKQPTAIPTKLPTMLPTQSLTLSPTGEPTRVPTVMPSPMSAAADPQSNATPKLIAIAVVAVVVAVILFLLCTRGKRWARRLRRRRTLSVALGIERHTMTQVPTRGDEL